MNENSISMAEYKQMQKKSKQSKMKNKICRSEDILDLKLDSLGERAYYNYLKRQIKTGRVTHFHTQVPIRLPGNTKYVIDFLVFYADGGYEYIDFKGMVTSTFKLKLKQVQAMYPLKVRCVARKGNKFVEKVV